MKRTIASLIFCCAFISSYAIKVIRVNQLGYLPKSVKVAVFLSSEKTSANNFSVYEALSDKVIFVGKRRGCYKYQQEQINELIVEQAKVNGHVVRLKGGDPFVFGRASEEVTNAYIVYALSEANYAQISKELEAAYASSTASNDAYQLALMTNTLFKFRNNIN